MPPMQRPDFPFLAGYYARRYGLILLLAIVALVCIVAFSGCSDDDDDRDDEPFIYQQDDRNEFDEFEDED